MSMDRYYILGRTGLRVSRLSMGVMTFGTNWGWGADKDASRKMFSMYLDAGGNFIDTADAYTSGTSEEWTGDFIAETRSRDKVVLATKYSNCLDPGNPNAGGNGRKNMMRAVDASLKRLKTDYIDLYILHTWDQLTPVEEVMRTFDDLVRAGKIRYVGLSDTPAWYAARAQTLAEERGYEPVSSLQLEYSLVERHIENEFTTLAAECGMAITVWSPLASGLLSGKYRSDGSGSGRLDTMKPPPGSPFHKFTERNWKIVAELEAVAKLAGHSMAQVAINWVANRPCVGSVILGATKPEQLQDNLGSLDFTLPEELRQRLDAATQLEEHFPYTFFSPSFLSRLHGGAKVTDKPEGYLPKIRE